MSIKSLWTNYLYSGTKGTSLEGDRVQFAFVNTFSIVGILSFALIGYAHIQWGSRFVGIIEVIFGFIGLLNLIALRFHKKPSIATLVIMAVMFVALIFLFFTGGYAGTGIFWFATFPILASFLRGKREGRLWIGAFLLSLILLWIAKTAGVIALPFSHVEIRELLFSLTAVSILIYFYQSVDEVNSVSLAEKEKDLTSRNEQIKGELVEASQAEDKLKTLVEESADTKKAVLNILEDVQEEKEKVEHISERFDRATKSAKIGVWEWDVVDNSITANQEFYQLYGVGKEQFSNAYEGWMKFIHPDEKDRVTKEISESLKSKSELNLVVRAVLGGESIRYFKVLSNINRDTAGKPVNVIGVQWDITKEKESEKAINEFVSLASHQLRTPMTAISWVAEILQKKEKLSEQGRKYLTDINFSVKRLSKLVDTLLNVSRIDEGRVVMSMKPVEIISTIESFLFECEPLCSAKKIKISFDKHPKKLDVMTDQDGFRNILQAIVSNAIEYTPEEGSITISLEEDSTEKTFTLRVADTGIGIPKEEQSKIFTKFARASNAQLVKTDGTGLGMYIAWQATKLLGGDIRFESIEKKGTTFMVTLPIESKASSKSGSGIQGKSLA